MQIGAMINPHANVYKELEWIGKNRFDFVDFTIEPEHPMPEQINVQRVKKIMKKYGLGIVGHIGDWRLPKESGYKTLRQAAEKEMLDAIKILKRLGAKKLTMHMPTAPHFDLKRVYQIYSKLIGRLIQEAKRQKVTLMIENDPNTREQRLLLDKLLKRFPKLKFHIDVGHANLRVPNNLTPYFMKKYSKRVIHFHFSDNYGKNDNHKYLGGGNISWTKIVKLLKKYKYDGTITVETFRPKTRSALLKSKKTLKRLWAQY
jgi:sugar phosphate isomerase/epimerase